MDRTWDGLESWDKPAYQLLDILCNTSFSALREAIGLPENNLMPRRPRLLDRASLLTLRRAHLAFANDSCCLGRGDTTPKVLEAAEKLTAVLGSPHGSRHPVDTPSNRDVVVRQTFNHFLDEAISEEDDRLRFVAPLSFIVSTVTPNATDVSLSPCATTSQLWISAQKTI
jgi:hypothetical protein